MAISAEHTLRRRSRLAHVRAGAAGLHSMTLEPQGRPSPMRCHRSRSRLNMNTRANAERSDTAMELEHLHALVCEIERLTQRSLAERGEVVTLAWLRGIVHRVEHLETAWRNTLPSTPKTTPEQQRRGYDLADSA